MLRNVRWTASAMLLAAMAVGHSGCEEKPLDPKEYGEVLSGVPKVPGADQSYPLPKLEAPVVSGPESTEQKPAEGPSADPSVGDPADPGK